MIRQLLAAAILLAAAPAAIAEPAGYLDLYYIPSAKVEVTAPGIGSGDDEGDGFGVKGMAPISYEFVFLGEYQSTRYDLGDEVNQARAGIGFMGEGSSGAILEYINADINGDSVDGFGIHLRFGGPQFYGQVGYVSLRDEAEDSGLELAFGMILQGRGNTGAFIDVRHTALERQDTSIETELTDIRAGVRVGF